MRRYMPLDFFEDIFDNLPVIEVSSSENPNSSDEAGTSADLSLSKYRTNDSDTDSSQDDIWSVSVYARLQCFLNSKFPGVQCIPIYDVIRIEGIRSYDYFRSIVTLPDVNDAIMATGYGPSRELAKKEATKELFGLLKSQPRLLLINPSRNQVTFFGNWMINENKRSNEYQIVSPVRILQELCEYRKWALPRYKEKWAKRKNDGDFVISCRLKHYRGEGVGRNKKTAKRNAAQKVWSLILRKSNK